MILEARAGVVSLWRVDPVRVLEREAVFGFAVVVAAAWVVLALMTGAGMSMTGLDHSAPGTMHGGGAMRGMAGMPRMAGMQGMAGMPGLSSGSGTGGVPAGAVMWVVMLTAMIVAMMLPSTFPVLRYAGARTLRWRRRRAMCEFAAGYLGVWLVAGALIVAMAALLRGLAGSLFAALCLAALWQLTPAKGRALRACHRSVPLPPHGWQADRAAIGFGARNASACVGSCWMMMLVASLVSTAALAWMAVLAGVVMAEKLAVRPRRASRRISVALAVSAAAVGAISLLV